MLDDLRERRVGLSLAGNTTLERRSQKTPETDKVIFGALKATRYHTFNYRYIGRLTYQWIGTTGGFVC